MVTFERICAYLGETDYRAIGRADLGRLTVRHRLGEYERSILNGGAEYAVRMVEPLIGCIRAFCGKRIPDDIVNAFNAWRAAEHAASVARIKAAPERYGEWSELESDPFFAPPRPVRGAYLSPDGTDWLYNDSDKVAA